MERVYSHYEGISQDTQTCHFFSLEGSFYSSSGIFSVEFSRSMYIEWILSALSIFLETRDRSTLTPTYITIWHRDIFFYRNIHRHTSRDTPDRAPRADTGISFFFEDQGSKRSPEFSLKKVDILTTLYDRSRLYAHESI
jgi:hypothetical protein